MNLGGILASNVCDLVNMDSINDPPFILFVFEFLELLRLKKSDNTPVYEHFCGDKSDVNGADIFILRCNCCHGKRKDESLQNFNFDAMILLKESRQCTVDVTRFVYNHLKTCLEGHKLVVYSLLRPNPSIDLESLKHFAEALYSRCKALVKWVKELPKPEVDPCRDTEIWVSLSKQQIRELWDRIGYIPVSNLMCPTEPKGEGCAVLECHGFPKYGLLHGALDAPKLSKMKSPRWRRKDSRKKKEFSSSRRVEKCEVLSWRAFLPSPSKPSRNLKFLKTTNAEISKAQIPIVKTVKPTMEEQNMGDSNTCKMNGDEVVDLTDRSLSEKSMVSKNISQSQLLEKTSITIKPILRGKQLCLIEAVMISESMSAQNPNKATSTVYSKTDRRPINKSVELVTSSMQMLQMPIIATTNEQQAGTSVEENDESLWEGKLKAVEDQIESTKTVHPKIVEKSSSLTSMMKGESLSNETIKVLTSTNENRIGMPIVESGTTKTLHRGISSKVIADNDQKKVSNSLHL